MARAEIHELPAIVSFPAHAGFRVEAPVEIAIQANTLGHSLATLPEGLTAELVYVGSGDFMRTGRQGNGDNNLDQIAIGLLGWRDVIGCVRQVAWP